MRGWATRLVSSSCRTCLRSFRSLVSAQVRLEGGRVQLQLAAKPLRSPPRVQTKRGREDRGVTADAPAAKQQRVLARARKCVCSGADAQERAVSTGMSERSRSGRVIKRKSKWGDGDEGEFPASKWRSM